jgi:hypothetical protein
MYTHHAQSRCQQRAIPNEAVEILMDFGEKGRHAGADVYYLSKRARQRAARSLGSDRYRRLEKSLNSYVVIGDDGCLVTVAHRYNRLKF